MSAPVLRPTELTDRALESRFYELTARFYGPRAASTEVTSRFYELSDRALESRYWEARSAGTEITDSYWEVAGRVWLAEIEDAAALLDLEDVLAPVEIETRFYDPMG